MAEREIEIPRKKTPENVIGEINDLFFDLQYGLYCTEIGKFYIYYLNGVKAVFNGGLRLRV